MKEHEGVIEKNPKHKEELPLSSTSQQYAPMINSFSDKKHQLSFGYNDLKHSSGPIEPS